MPSRAALLSPVQSRIRCCIRCPSAAKARSPGNQPPRIDRHSSIGACAMHGERMDLIMVTLGIVLSAGVVEGAGVGAARSGTPPGRRELT
ncbi:hypothetical protein GCM10027406_13790 [Leifsonia lichenia]